MIVLFEYRKQSTTQTGECVHYFLDNFKQLRGGQCSESSVFSGNTSHGVLLCQHSCFSTTHMVKVAPGSNENSQKHAEE